MGSHISLTLLSQLIGKTLVAILLCFATYLSACAAQATTTVVNVIDGDTVVLDDNTRVRLLGVNCPEFGHDGVRDEPLAAAAREFVASLVLGQRIALMLEDERTDRHGRTLAHIVLDDGRNLQEEILLNGLGSVVAIPPNVTLVEKYQEAERVAQRERRGIWSHRYYQPRRPSSLSGNDRGHRFVAGTVQRIERNRKNYFLELSRRFSIVIPRIDWSTYWSDDIDRLLGTKVIVRGWMTRINGVYRIRVRHPAMLSVSSVSSRYSITASREFDLLGG